VVAPPPPKYMYGVDRIAAWKAARAKLFGDDASLMKLFDSDVVIAAGLD
jgi:hypothetical protein